MNVCIKKLTVTTRRNTEIVDFSPTVTFLYGPVGTGKSTVPRLIDYCLGGNLERTPAVQQEFVAATLAVELGKYDCQLERAATDTQAVRVSWSNGDSDFESVNAPIQAGDVRLIDDGDVYNLSDLLFFLCGVTPIKVRKRFRDPESRLIRLSFRDVWWYCYLDQAELDSSFFRLEQPFRGRKSQDVMRFFTGLQSERLSQLEAEIFRTMDEQKGKREAVVQIRDFMARFELPSGVDLGDLIRRNDQELEQVGERRATLEKQRTVDLHPTDRLREELRELGKEIDNVETAVGANEEAIAEQRALRAELITAKIKAERADQARKILDGVEYKRCPKCGTDLTDRIVEPDRCTLCLSSLTSVVGGSGTERETVRRDLNERIDQIEDSIGRRERAMRRSIRELDVLRRRKRQLDERLQGAVERYDSPFVDSIRELEREGATLVERRRFLEKLQEMRKAVNLLASEAGALQGKVDSLRNEMQDERSRLREADRKVTSIAKHFKTIMRNVGFPGVAEGDRVVVDSRNWRPTIQHNEQEWSFWDAGSGGKKTLFNVCYALAIHAAGMEDKMPVPNILIIDSPTKNISDDEDPELVEALYREIYRFAATKENKRTQFLLIDSDLAEPKEHTPHFRQRRMAGVPDAPSLFSQYEGP